MNVRSCLYYGLALILIPAILACSPEGGRSTAGFASTSKSVDEMVLFDDDMMMQRSQFENSDGSVKNQKAGGFFDDHIAWPGGVIPLVFDPSLSAAQRDATMKGCAVWTAAANVKCVVRSTEESYLTIINDPAKSPYSVLGFIPPGPNGPKNYNMKMNLAGIWDPKWIYYVAHEFGHAFGFWHEQHRADRDSFIKVHFENMIPGISGNFVAVPFAQAIGKPFYDFLSVMHYPSMAGSANGLPTMTALAPNEAMTARMGEGLRVGLSAGDREAIAILYGPPVVPPPPPAACSSNATSLAIGATLTCACSASASRSGTVVGTMAYKDSSKICRAAVHSGAISVSGGTVTISVAVGQVYVGSSANGVTSTSAAASAKSFSFGSTGPAINGVASVALISPFQGTTQGADMPIVLKATALAMSGASIAKVEFYDGASKIGEAKAAPYSLTVKGLSVGTHIFVAKAFDMNGNFKISSSVTVTITPATSVFTAQVVSAYSEYLPGCLNPSNQSYWENYLASGGLQTQFIATLKAASTPQTIAGCYNWTKGVARTQSITAIYSRYLPGCLTPASLAYWDNWFDHPSALPADFVATARASQQTCSQ